VVQDTEDTRKKTRRGRGGDVDNEWDVVMSIMSGMVVRVNMNRM